MRWPRSALRAGTYVLVQDKPSSHPEPSIKPKSAVSSCLEGFAFLMCYVVFPGGGDGTTLLAEGMECVDTSALAEVATHQWCVPQARWPKQPWCVQAVEPSEAKVGSIQPRALVALVVTHFQGHRRDRLRGERGIPGATPLQ